MLARDVEERIGVRAQKPGNDDERVLRRDATIVLVEERHDVRMRAVAEDGEVSGPSACTFDGYERHLRHPRRGLALDVFQSVEVGAHRSILHTLEIVAFRDYVLDASLDHSKEFSLGVARPIPDARRAAEAGELTLHAFFGLARHPSVPRAHRQLALLGRQEQKEVRFAFHAQESM